MKLLSSAHCRRISIKNYRLLIRTLGVCTAVDNYVIYFIPHLAVMNQYNRHGVYICGVMYGPKKGRKNGA